MRYALVLALGAALLPAAAPAQVKLLYANDFDTENGGKTAIGIDSFTGFSTPAFGIDPPPTVNLVFTGDGRGITCAGGTGGCLDLGGDTRSEGLLFSDATYAFQAGDVFTLKYSIGGSQRSGVGTNGYNLGFFFDDLHAFDYVFQTSGGKNETGTLDDYGFTITNEQVLSTMPFVDVTLILRPKESGTFFIGIDGYSYNPADTNDMNAGLILDNLSLSQGVAAMAAVPEPATWTMMITGFGAAGCAMRRRRIAAGGLLAG